MTCQTCITWGVLLDYIRMVGYAVVILSSLRGIMARRFSNWLFVGDILVASALFSTLFLNNFMGQDLKTTVDIIATPAVVIWAIIHYKQMLDFEKQNLK